MLDTKATASQNQINFRSKILSSYDLQTKLLTLWHISPGYLRGNCCHRVSYEAAVNGLVKIFGSHTPWSIKRAANLSRKGGGKSAREIKKWFNSEKFALGVCFESFISCSSKSFSHTFYWQSFNQERSVRRPLKSFPRKQYKPRWVKLLAKCGREMGNKENLLLPTFVFANSSLSKVWIKFERSYQGRTILKSSSASDLIRQDQTKN